MVKRGYWWIVILLLIATSLSFLDRQILSVSILKIREDLTITDVAYGFINAGFLVSFAVMFTLGGILIDRYGSRLGLAFSVGFWSFATILHSLSNSVFHFGLFRFFLGVGEGACFPGAIKAVMELVPASKRALANLMPQSHPALKLVKGMGKKKSGKFGDELLDIIISYCKKESIEPTAVAPAEKMIEKKKKEDTKKISFGLFKEGRTIAQIAEERKLSITTIEGHLAHYVGTGEIALSKFVAKETADLIASHFEGTDDLKMGPVKEALGDKVSWSEIRFVINHVMFLRKP